jgi:hypothetical protein
MSMLARSAGILLDESSQHADLAGAAGPRQDELSVGPADGLIVQPARTQTWRRGDDRSDSAALERLAHLRSISSTRCSSSRPLATAGSASRRPLEPRGGIGHPMTCFRTTDEPPPGSRILQRPIGARPQVAAQLAQVDSTSARVRRAKSVSHGDSAYDCSPSLRRRADA